MYSMRGKVPRLWSQTTQSLPVSTPISPRRSTPWVQVRCVQMFPLQEQAEQIYETQEDRSKESPIEDDAGPACKRGVSTASGSQTITSKGLTL